jgi:hypothetical protein
MPGGAVDPAPTDPHTEAGRMTVVPRSKPEVPLQRGHGPSSPPGQPWLWLYTLWYHVPGFSASANVDLIAIYLIGLATILLLAIPFIPGLRDIFRWIPVHRLIWHNWEPAHGRAEGGPGVAAAPRQHRRLWLSYTNQPKMIF